MRPYTIDFHDLDNTVNMIGHDHKILRIKTNFFADARGCKPFVLDDSSDGG